MKSLESYREELGEELFEVVSNVITMASLLGKQVAYGVIKMNPGDKTFIVRIPDVDEDLWFNFLNGKFLYLEILSNDHIKEVKDLNEAMELCIEILDR